MKDYSFLGYGEIHIKEFGAAAPYTQVGNSTSFNITPEEDTKKVRDGTRPGGGTRNRVDRLLGFNLSYNFTDFSPANFVRSLRGGLTTLAAGTVTDEEVVAYEDGYTPLARIAATITTVEPVGGGTAYVVDTDYTLENGQLYLPSTTTIPAPVAGAANCQVTYTSTAQSRVDAAIDSSQQYSIMFVGANEAQNNKRVRVICHKVSGGLLKQMAVLGEEFGVGDVDGSLLADTTRTGSTESQYFTWEMEDL